MKSHSKNQQPSPVARTESNLERSRFDSVRGQLSKFSAIGNIRLHSASLLLILQLPPSRPSHPLTTTLTLCSLLPRFFLRMVRSLLVYLFIHSFYVQRPHIEADHIFTHALAVSPSIPLPVCQPCFLSFSTCVKHWKAVPVLLFGRFSLKSHAGRNRLSKKICQIMRIKKIYLQSPLDISS